MDILIRLIIMLMCGIAIPYISNMIYEPLKYFKELDIVEKILWSLFYIFLMNWFIITPSLIFVNCFKYIFLQ